MQIAVGREQDHTGGTRMAPRASSIGEAMPDAELVNTHRRRTLRKVPLGATMTPTVAYFGTRALIPI